MSGKPRNFVHKNPNRQKQSTAPKPYVPIYKQLNIEPEFFQSAVVPMEPVTKNVNTPSLPTTVKQSYGNVYNGNDDKNYLPNVGNSTEQTWTGFDSEMLSEESVSPDAEMIDNNDYVTEQALGLPPTTEGLEIKIDSDLMEILSELESSSFLLFVNNSPICAGSEDDIKNEIKSLITGEHEICNGESVSEDQIMVFKKMNVKLEVALD